MMSAIPMPTAIPQLRSKKPRYGMLVGFAALGFLPIIGAGVLALSLSGSCATTPVQEGIAGRALAWRIDRVACAGAEPLHTVSVGASGKTLTLAASVRGAPAPKAVIQGEDGGYGLLFDAPDRPPVKLTLKSSGRPTAPLIIDGGKLKS